MGARGCPPSTEPSLPAVHCPTPSRCVSLFAPLYTHIYTICPSGRLLHTSCVSGAAPHVARKMPAWTALRDQALLDAVRSHGRYRGCWADFARLPELSVFSSESIRHRWRTVLAPSLVASAETFVTGDPEPVELISEYSSSPVRLPALPLLPPEPRRHVRRPWQQVVRRTHACRRDTTRVA